LRPAEIKEIQRQKDRYKAAVKALSEGRTLEGFRTLDRLGWIHEVADEERDRALADAYVDSLCEGKSALVIAPTHAAGERITREIRRELRARHLLGTAEHEFDTLVPVNLTLGQRRDPATYAAGDLVVLFHQNAKGFRKGQRLDACAGPVPLDQAERFTLYRKAGIELASGDRVRITRNGTTADGAHRLSNGDIFTVKAFTSSGDLVLDNGWTVSREWGHIALGHVSTSHASQGRTVDRVFVGMSSESLVAASREGFYVSASRAREQAQFFTDSKRELLDAVSHDDERLSGTELVAEAKRIQRHLIRDRNTVLEAVTQREPEALIHDR
jgi:hypothetical protein